MYPARYMATLDSALDTALSMYQYGSALIPGSAAGLRPNEVARNFKVMTEPTGPKQDRAVSGRFRPGVSGNPAGRPRGSRNRATLIAQDLLDSDSEDLVKTAIKRAKKGDPVALRLCIERLMPPRRSGSAAL